MDDNESGYKEETYHHKAEASTNSCEPSPNAELVTLSPHRDAGNGTPSVSESTAAWKPFGCEICGKRFTLKGSLKTHEKLHGFRPTYNCHECGKSFKVANGLKAHAALHSGSKPFSCHICGKTFTLKGSLKTHSALHSAVRESFRCHICGKTYKGLASLRSHTALHLGEQNPLPPKVCEQPCTHSTGLGVPSTLFSKSSCHLCEVEYHVLQHALLQTVNKFHS